MAVIYDTLAVITTMSKDAVSHLIEFDTVAETWSSLVPLPRKLTHPVHFGRDSVMLLYTQRNNEFRLVK